MKVERDAAYVQSLLEEILGGRTNFHAFSDSAAEKALIEPFTGLTTDEAEKMAAHLTMMKSEGLITYEGPSTDRLFSRVRVR